MPLIVSRGGTACRRSGALAIRLDDLDPHRCLVKLSEEGCTVRYQPITQLWPSALLPRRRPRCGPAHRRTPALPQRPPPLSRRHDHLWNHLGDQLPESPPGHLHPLVRRQRHPAAHRRRRPERRPDVDL